MEHGFCGDGQEGTSLMFFIKTHGQKGFWYLEQKNQWVKRTRGNPVHFEPIAKSIIDFPQRMINILLGDERLAIVLKSDCREKQVPVTRLAQLQYIDDVVCVNEKFGARQADGTATYQ